MTGKLQRLLIVSTLASPTTLYALGLGDIQLHSALNQPLSAEIELISATPEELGALKAGLASRETFARYGIEVPASLTNLRFVVSRNGKGRDVLQVTSRESISEPFLTFLVEVNWTRGKLLREYTLLLDPPVYMPGEPAGAAPVAAPQTGTETPRSGTVQRPAEPTRSQAQTVKPAVPAEPAPRPAPSSGGEPTLALGGGSYKVKSNDTLWRIASELKPGTTTEVNRMMVALYRANPEAFAGNINELRAGAILRVPTGDQFDAVGAGEARDEVRRQYADWRGARGEASSSTAANNERLRLVTPKESQPAAPTGAPVAADPALQDRVRRLESQLSESQRMLELRNAELARLQQQLGQKQAAPAPAPAAPTTAAAPQPQPAAPAPSAEAPASPETPVEAPPPVTEPVTEPAPEAKQPVAPTATKPEEAAGERSIIGWLKDNWYFPLAGLLILVGILFNILRKRQEPDFDALGKLAGGTDTLVSEPPFGRDARTQAGKSAKSEDAFLVEESGEREQPMFVPAAKAARPAETTRARSEPAKTADDTLSSETAINLDQGDPLAEADFHMAYGLYDQAADLVRMAIEREPARRDLRLKLLEIFFVWGNKDAFLDAVQELQASRSDAAPGEWDKIVIMGKQIAPEHHLFAHAASAGAPSSDVDLNLEGGESRIERIDLDVIGGIPSEDDDNNTRTSIDLDLSGIDESARTRESPALKETSGIDFVFDEPMQGADSGATTREMLPKVDSPTVESEYRPGSYDAPTVESPALSNRASSTIKEKIDSAMFRKDRQSSDQTAELAIDDLGLELDALNELENVDSLDALEKTDHPRDRLEETDHPADAPTMLAGMDEKSRRLMQGAQSRADLDRTVETPRSEQEDDISGTGTWIMSEDSLAGTDFSLPGESGATTRVASLDDDGTQRRRVDTEVTSEMPRPGRGDMDLDLDSLEAALVSDTAKQPRRGSSSEERFSADVFSGGEDFTATDIDLDVSEARQNHDREVTLTERIPAAEMGLPELEPVTMSEVGTKLDLARAYMDMGDPEGARSILDEVLQEGSATQKQEAQRLLESLPG